MSVSEIAGELRYTDGLYMDHPVLILKRLLHP
jgi:hypothetical protein